MDGLFLLISLSKGGERINLPYLVAKKERGNIHLIGCVYNFLISNSQNLSLAVSKGIVSMVSISIFFWAVSSAVQQ
jgi:hypothetical protein